MPLCICTMLASCPAVHLSSRPVCPAVQFEQLYESGQLDTWTDWTPGQLDAWTTGQTGCLDRLDTWTSGQTGQLNDWTAGKVDDLTDWTFLAMCATDFSFLLLLLYKRGTKERKQYIWPETLVKVIHTWISREICFQVVWTLPYAPP